MSKIFGLVVMSDAQYLEEIKKATTRGKNMQKFHSEGGYASQLKKSQEKVAKMAHLLDDREDFIQKLRETILQYSPFGAQDPVFQIAYAGPSDAALNKITEEALQPSLFDECEHEKTCDTSDTSDTNAVADFAEVGADVSAERAAAVMQAQHEYLPGQDPRD